MEYSHNDKRCSAVAQENFFCFAETRPVRSHPPDRSAKAEVEKYLLEPGAHDATDVSSILRFWTAPDTRAQFPRLSRVARRLLAGMCMNVVGCFYE